MKITDRLDAIKKHCAYVQEHIENVHVAWSILKERCGDMRFIYDDYVFFTIAEMIESHDASKLSAAEFVPYADWFFSDFGKEWESMDVENYGAHRVAIASFDEAWEHHKANNLHHWQSWGSRDFYNPYEAEMHCVCMVCDWMAMGMKFGDTAEDYYSANKDKMTLPPWADQFLQEIFKAVER